jgi:hypothetical protein
MRHASRRHPGESLDPFRRRHANLPHQRAGILGTSVPSSSVSVDVPVTQAPTISSASIRFSFFSGLQGWVQDFDAHPERIGAIVESSNHDVLASESAVVLLSEIDHRNGVFRMLFGWQNASPSPGETTITVRVHDPWVTYRSGGWEAVPSRSFVVRFTRND